MQSDKRAELMASRIDGSVYPGQEMEPLKPPADGLTVIQGLLGGGDPRAAMGVVTSWEIGDVESMEALARHMSLADDDPMVRLNPLGEVMDCVRVSFRPYQAEQFPRTNRAGEVVPSVMTVFEGARGEIWRSSSPFAGCDGLMVTQLLRHPERRGPVRIRCAKGGQCVRVYVAPGVPLTDLPAVQAQTAPKASRSKS